MARMISSAALAISLLSLSSALSLPPTSSLSINPQNETYNQLPSNMTTWLYVSGDGNTIEPIPFPGAIPANLAATGGASNGHSYAFGFGSYHGDLTSGHDLSKFLFECEFGLFGQIANPGQGVWRPYPQGRYRCNGNLPNRLLSVDLAQNDVRWKMAYHDLAYVNKVLHDVEGLKDETPFFDFHINYTPDQESTAMETVAYGSWRGR